MIVNRGSGYNSVPSLAVNDPECLCELRVNFNRSFLYICCEFSYLLYKQATDIPGSLDGCLKLSVAVGGRSDINISELGCII